MIEIKGIGDGNTIEVLKDVSTFSSLQCIKGKEWRYADLRSMGKYPHSIKSSQLTGSDFTGVNMKSVFISDTKLDSAMFVNANLSYATLIGVDFRYTDFTGANIREASFVRCNVEQATFKNADLSHSLFSTTEIERADLSEAILDYNPEQFLKDNFEHTKEGILGYKIFGLYKPSPATWVIKPGSIITENVCRNVYLECSHGVNIFNKKFAMNAWGNHVECPAIWQVLIRYDWLLSVIVPYESVRCKFGVIRAGKVELIETVKDRKSLIKGY